MSNAKHSPAPWRFEIDAKRDEVFGYAVTAADGKEIGYWDADDRPETEANARLIGSATDMAAAIATQAAQIEALTLQRDELLKVGKNAAAGIVAIYEWLDRVEQAGGAKSISGVAACHAMLTSLRKNGNRTETLILAPLRAAIAGVGDKHD